MNSNTSAPASGANGEPTLAECIEIVEQIERLGAMFHCLPMQELHACLRYRPLQTWTVILAHLRSLREQSQVASPRAPSKDGGDAQDAQDALDARRYRWLRTQDWVFHCLEQRMDMNYERNTDEEMVDDAVDAAMGQIVRAVDPKDIINGGAGQP